MMVALVSIFANQDKSNETTYQSIKTLLYYCYTHPDSTIIYKKISMVLRVHSDGSYLL